MTARTCRTALTWLIALTVCLSGGFPATPIALATPPANFYNETRITGLNEPTGLVFTPDGRMFILERGGVIKLAQPNATQVDPTPLLTLTNINTDQGERGLTGLALDPNFNSNGFLYVFYTRNAPLRDRVARFTVTGNTAEPGSEVVIYEDDQEAGLWHHGGSVAFGPDGKLYLSVGDNFDTGYGNNHVSQRLDSYRGKILRLNADGSPPADNPFYQSGGSVIQNAVWALGLRNPYRFSFDSQTGVMYIGDVGSNNADSNEELNRGIAGANYGWPWCEGNCDTPGMTNPLYRYSHTGRDASIIGGVVYRGTQFPAEYQGSYFFGDYAQNWIRRATFGLTGTVSAVLPFEPADGSLDGPYGNPVDVKIAPDGMLYYVDIGTIGLPGTGSVRRIRYDLSNQPPVITTATADPLSGPMAPLTVNFSGAATDPENDPLNYLWEFGDGITSTLPSPTHLYTGRGYYTARLTVSDSENQTLSAPIRLTVGMPPQVTVTAPTNNHIFVAGEVITFTGTATDPDGVLTPANYTWRVIFHHNEHLHPAEGPITGATSGSFTIPITGHDFSGNTRFEILLTVTDADGIPTTQSVWVYPRKVNVTLATTPPGLGVTIDQSSGLVSPITRDTLAGFQHSVTVPPIQTLNGQTVYFGGWTDGITTSTRLVTIPLTNTTVTANFFYRTFLPVMRR